MKTGETIVHERIVGLLGAGGMGGTRPKTPASSVPWPREAENVPAQMSSARLSSSLTRFGFAFPAAAFITLPTRKPNALVLPPR